MQGSLSWETPPFVTSWLTDARRESGAVARKEEEEDDSTMFAPRPPRYVPLPCSLVPPFSTDLLSHSRLGLGAKYTPTLMSSDSLQAQKLEALLRRGKKQQDDVSLQHAQELAAEEKKRKQKEKEEALEKDDRRDANHVVRKTLSYQERMTQLLQTKTSKKRKRKSQTSTSSSSS